MKRREFFPEHRVPAEVEALVRAGEAKDASWDGGPAVRLASSVPETQADVSLWVGHPDPRRRALGFPRFVVDAGGGDPRLYSGDDARAAVQAFRRGVREGAGAMGRSEQRTVTRARRLLGGNKGGA